MNREGNASVTVLVFLFVLSAIFISAAFFMRSIIGFVWQSDFVSADRMLLRDEAARLLGIMCEDPTPEADSPLDPIWTEIKLAGGGEIDISLEDIASRINPNQAYDYLLNAAGVFKPPVNYDLFHKMRIDTGPTLRLRSEYDEYFTEEALETLLSVYNYFNINTSNEGMLYKLFELRTGKKAESTPFSSSLRSMRTEKKLVTRESIGMLLGTDLESVYPFIGCEAEMNVNFVPRPVLAAVIGTAKTAFKLELKDGVIDAIISTRDNSEITDAQLAGLLGPKSRNTILESYLGCRTWFWRLSLSKKTVTYHCVICRVPDMPGKKAAPVTLRIVEESYVREGGANSPAGEETDHD